jgi:hypothetical protein
VTDAPYCETGSGGNRYSDLIADIQYRTVICLIAKGRSLPGYLASLELRDRMAVLAMLDTFTGTRLIPENLLKVLVTQPEYITALAAYNAIGDRLDKLAAAAREEKSRWSMTEVSEIITEASQLAGSASHRQRAHG